MMQKSPLHARLIVTLLAAALAASAHGATAMSIQDPGWRIRFFAASVDFDNADVYTRGTRPDYDLDLGVGIGVNAEYRLSRRLGIDLGIFGGAALDVAWESRGAGDWVWAAYDTLTFTPITAGLDIHLTPESNVDLFVCPMLAWVHYGGIVVHSGSYWEATTIDFEQDLGIGLTLGLAVPLGAGRRWSFAANLTHLENQLDGTGSLGEHLSGDYDATILGLGFGYRF